MNGDKMSEDDMTYEKSQGLILDDTLSTEDQIDVILNSKYLSDEQKEQAIDKIGYISQKSLKTTDISTQSNSSGHYITIAVPYFKQINTYYCGPATTKQTIHYLTGSSDSQEVIAKALGTTTSGTDGTKIIDYLNEKQSKVYYMSVTPSSVNSMEETIYSGLSYYKSAPILRLRIEGNEWSYSSTGHFMNISGIYTGLWGDNDVNQYEVTDPYIEYANKSETDGKYKISTTSVYNSTISHFAQTFYF